MAQFGLDLVEQRLFGLKVALRCGNAVFFWLGGPSSVACGCLRTGYVGASQRNTLQVPLAPRRCEYRHAVGECACPLRDKKHTCRRLEWRMRRSCCSCHTDPACFAKSDVVNKRAVHQHVSQRTKRGRLRRTQPVPAMAFSCGTGSRVHF